MELPWSLEAACWGIKYLGDVEVESDVVVVIKLFDVMREIHEGVVLAWDVELFGEGYYVY